MAVSWNEFSKEQREILHIDIQNIFSNRPFKNKRTYVYAPGKKSRHIEKDLKQIGTVLTKLGANSSKK